MPPAIRIRDLYFSESALTAVIVEIAFVEKKEVVHRGYSTQERSGYTFRSKPFDTKTSLTCWAMANNQEVLINDFDKEHTMYIQEKEAYRFSSLLFIEIFLILSKDKAAKL